MQDNEFDELFRSKLENLEAQPSAKVWPGITSGLDAGTRRKSIAPFLNMAASVLILVTAGIVFIPQTGKVNIRHHVGHVIPKVSGQIAGATTADSTSVRGVANTGVKKAENKVQTLAVRDKKTNITTTGNSVDTTASGIIPVKTNNQILVAATPQIQHNTIAPVVPDDNTPLTVNVTDDPLHAIPAKPVASAAVTLPNVNPEAAPVKTRHKIRNLGDLVNLVAAKIDKRNGKLIDEDGESNIIGVNLGVLKFKKEE